VHALRRLTKKCKTPKANGNFHSWKRNQKATSALKWALRHASYITLGRLENVAVDDSIDEAMAEVKSSLGKFFDEMKEKGKVDECDADVMPLELYHLLCAEFLRRGMFLAWAWLTSGWNHVCRHDNIKSMAFHMFNIKFQTPLGRSSIEPRRQVQILAWRHRRQIPNTCLPT